MLMRWSILAAARRSELLRPPVLRLVGSALLLRRGPAEEADRALEMLAALPARCCMRSSTEKAFIAFEMR